jgi:glycyl-tRNA synthetase (class II)
MQDRTVTIRHRDTLTQDRVGTDHVVNWLLEQMRR